MEIQRTIFEIPLCKLGGILGRPTAHGSERGRASAACEGPAASISKVQARVFLSVLYLVSSYVDTWAGK